MHGRRVEAPRPFAGLCRPDETVAAVLRRTNLNAEGLQRRGAAKTHDRTGVRNGEQACLKKGKRALFQLWGLL